MHIEVPSLIHTQVLLPLLRFFSCSIMGIALSILFHSPSMAASQIPDELKDASITEHLGDSLSLQDLEFKDESGQVVRLGQYFDGKRPVLLSLVYYECPNLCNFVLNGLVDGLKSFQWTPGREFQIVTVSINPKEGPELAKQKKSAYLNAYGKSESSAGWHFLTGEEPQIKKLASQVGFGYKWDEKEKQYAHSAALFVLTPQGKISRYLYGIQYAEKDLKLSLLEASNGKIGTIIDRIILFCYRYNSETRKYSVVLARVMQAGSAGTVLVFGSYLAVFWRRQRRLTGSKERQGG